jgi:hypothetical protein
MKMRSFLHITLLLISAAMTGCFPDITGGIHREIVNRISSPNGNVDAIVEVIDGGATTSRAFAVYLVPIGFKPKSDIDREKYQMVVFDGAVTEGSYGIKIHWESAFEAVVSYDRVKNTFEKKRFVEIHGNRYQISDAADINAEQVAAGNVR